jgi:hypothetical protein
MRRRLASYGALVPCGLADPGRARTAAARGRLEDVQKEVELPAVEVDRVVNTCGGISVGAGSTKPSYASGSGRA